MATSASGNTTMRRSPAAAAGVTEELLWTRTKTSTPSSTLRATRISLSSHHLRISPKRITEERPSSFSPVPTKAEAEAALSALQRLFFSDASSSTATRNTDSTELVERVSSAESGSTMIASAPQLHQPKLVQPRGVARVFEAFRLAVFNPLVQRMVVSLSTDKAVWDAVMKNKAVQEIQQSFIAESTKPQNAEGESVDIGTLILRWILENTKAKLIEFIDKIAELVNELFRSKEREKNTRSKFDQVVRSAFMISIIVFMIIIVTRMECASRSFHI